MRNHLLIHVVDTNELIFMQKYREFLGGFRKRKLERKRKAQEQLQQQLKEERKKIKQEVSQVSFGDNETFLEELEKA